MLKKSIYRGLAGCVSTMHNKERVIAPVFSECIGLTLSRSDVNTDLLGTFSGETPRTGSMLETAIRKAQLGIEKEGLKIGIASEGSFGPHPIAFTFPVAHECMVFVDTTNNIIVSEFLMTEKTNFSQIKLHAPLISDAFLNQALFPSHQLIVTYQKDHATTIIKKDISSYDALEEAIKSSFKQSIDGSVVVQTDMRAHMNPTRMETIRVLTHNLVKRVATVCPSCDCPGFGKISLEPGLLCLWCQMPTDQVKNRFAHCVRCDFRKVILTKKAQQYADPSQCGNCNP